MYDGAMECILRPVQCDAADAVKGRLLAAPPSKGVCGPLRLCPTALDEICDAGSKQRAVVWDRAAVALRAHKHHSWCRIIERECDFEHRSRQTNALHHPRTSAPSDAHQTRTCKRNKSEQKVHLQRVCPQEHTRSRHAAGSPLTRLPMYAPTRVASRMRSVVA